MQFVDVRKVKYHQPFSVVGKTISHIDWLGNLLADKQAKFVVALHPVPVEHQSRLKYASQLVDTTARWLGHTLAAADSFVNHNSAKRHVMDGGADRPAKQQPTERAAVPQPKGDGTTSGPDAPAPDTAVVADGRLSVVGFATTDSTVMTEGRFLAARCHPTHAVWQNGPVVFCVKCGGTATTVRMKKLTGVCAKHPADHNAVNRLQLRRAGVHPQSRVFLGTPAPAAAT